MADQREKVLLVDDDDLSREVLALLLEAAGYQVTAAESGQGAIDLVEAGKGAAPGARPDVILTDLQMPGICGEELRARLAAICGAGTAILAMSGTRPGEAALADFDGFLLKPFSMEELGKAIEDSRTASEPAGEAVQELPVEAEQDLAILDERTFSELSQMLRKQQMDELYSMCLRDSLTHIRAMEAAVGEGDEASFRRHAHAMKGTFGMVGARELQAAAGEAETYNLWSMVHGPVTKDNLQSGMKRLRRMLVARGIEVDASGESTA